MTAEKITRVHRENYSVYVARKVYAALNREGYKVARCTVERLMHRTGLHGVRRAKGPRTTLPGPLAERPADLARRQFSAPAPNCLWVAGITYIRTFSGWVYAAFVLDVFSRRVVGWQLSTWTSHPTNKARPRVCQRHSDAPARQSRCVRSVHRRSCDSPRSGFRPAATCAARSV
ncbi:IS3 family transposase [Arthrobacter sp. UYEF3]|uniref:IS3 family transposase n=1 Tax=Arthrobacter sp. UYEF3 TaxID=1756365 RepID=UPI00339B34D3